MNWSKETKRTTPRRQIHMAGDALHVICVVIITLLTALPVAIHIVASFVGQIVSRHPWVSILTCWVAGIIWVARVIWVMDESRVLGKSYRSLTRWSCTCTGIYKDHASEHTPGFEVDACRCKFVQLLVGEEYLFQCIAMIWLMIRLLGRWDVLGLSDWWTEAVGHTEHVDEVGVVGRGVLPWQSEPIWTDSKHLKDGTAVIEMLQALLYL